MAFLVTLQDLTTHIYEEIIDEITREDDSIAQEAIDTAIAEAKGFMSRFDLPALFGTAITDPTVIDKNLKGKVKDLVRWHLVGLGINNIDYAMAEQRYLMALEKYFMPLQKGMVNPEGWPYRDTATAPTPAPGNEVSWSSNRKRRNHY